MKILFISNFFDNTGWSQAGINYCLSLDSVGVDVVPRPIKLNQNWDKNVPPRLLELSKKDIRGCNVVIQHVLPHFMEYNGNFDKNIGLAVFETSNFNSTDWARHINLMDELWVPCQHNKQTCINSGVKIPIQVVPHTFDMTVFEQQYKPLPIKELKDKFTFYFIGELNKRKNIESLLRAFHTEFKSNEDVALLLKLNIPGYSPEQTAKLIANLIENIKSGLQLYKDIRTYIPEVVLTGHLSDREMMQLHTTCDCYVSPSYGEAWEQSSFVSMAMGKSPIVTKGLGMDDYIRGQNYIGGMLVNSRDEIIYDAPCPVSDLYTGQSTWKSIDVLDLRRCMREMYTNKEARQKYAKDGINGAYNFSWQNIGQQMKKLLEK